VSLAACGSGGGSGVDGPPGGSDGPPLTGDHFTATWGPVSIPGGGTESTACVTIKLNNPTPVKIHQIHNTLSTVTHHFIVYRDNSADPVENTTPTPCQPFAGTLDLNGGRSPMMITQRSDEVLTLPDGVAYSFGANQFIRLEMHYINASDMAADALGTAEFYVIPDDQVTDEADFLFIGSPDIDFTLQPGQSSTLNAFFPTPSTLTGANYFALTGHTHALGTDMNISTAQSQGGALTEVYNPEPFSWSEPETVTHNPPFTIPAGGGFDFTCEWTNGGTAPASRQFGESANDEMCFFWAYYYPSQGAKVCIHTDQFGGFNGCCPDIPQICSALKPQPH
jgi:hypothetical protein